MKAFIVDLLPSEHQIWSFFQGCGSGSSFDLDLVFEIELDPTVKKTGLLEINLDPDPQSWFKFSFDFFEETWCICDKPQRLIA